MAKSPVNVGHVAHAPADLMPPTAVVETVADAPVRKINPQELRRLGQKLDTLFKQYVSDRRIAELRWLRNERQYLGLYDPEIEKELSANRSKAYPRITRVKVLTVLSRLMNLMFPGNERNWELKASPSPDMKPADVKEAIARAVKADQEIGQKPELTLDYVMSAIQTLADRRAEDLTKLIDDQLQEVGGDQTLDYIALNRRVLLSGTIYGLGVLRGPYAREKKAVVWEMDKATGTPKPVNKTVYMPLFEHLRVWDFYPDMSAKTFEQMDGYFTREVMSRSQVRALGRRADFLEDQIKAYLKDNAMGNYRPQPFETELRAMGVRVNVNEMKTETSKYEVIVWHGQTSGQFLALAGLDIDEDKLADDLDAEIWMINGNVIKAALNPWTELGVTSVKMIHTFLFDEDDTSPIGFGLPNAIRDSQMAISAATRMLLDNASITCGPNLEVNTDLLRPDQDLTSVSAYKIWYREGVGQESGLPAVKNVVIDAHMEELLKVIELFMKFADTETFVGPATGGDASQQPSEPMRTAAGASMLRGDAALPFKDVVRNFDTFTQSVLSSLVQFNRKFNPDRAPEGDYNVIARGATSLIAKEVRGMQIDQLVATLTDAERLHVDDRKLATARFAVRDMTDLLVSQEEADRRKKAQDATMAQQQQSQQEMVEANIRKLLSDAFKNIAQGQKNSAAADAQTVEIALDVLERGLTGAGVMANGTGAGAANGQAGVPPGADQDAGGVGGVQGSPGNGAAASVSGQSAGGGAGGAGGMPPG